MKIMEIELLKEIAKNPKPFLKHFIIAQILVNVLTGEKCRTGMK